MRGARIIIGVVMLLAGLFGVATFPAGAEALGALVWLLAGFALCYAAALDLLGEPR